MSWSVDFSPWSVFQTVVLFAAPIAAVIMYDYVAGLIVLFAYFTAAISIE